MSAIELVRTRAPIVHFASFFLAKRKREVAIATAAFCCVMLDALKEHDDETKEACEEKPNLLHVLPNESSGAGGGCPSNPRMALLQQRLDEIYENRIDRSIDDEEHHVIRTFTDIARERVPESYLLDLGDARVSENEARVGASLSLIAAAVLGVTHSDAKRAIESLGVAIWFSEKGAKDDRVAAKFQEGVNVLPWLAGDGSKLAASIIVVAYQRMLNGGGDANRLAFLQRVALLPRAWRLSRRAPN